MPRTTEEHQAESDAMLARLGQRVRRARSQKGLPRRLLSELSGVSPRYLAQLEAGSGNISVSLLCRVAQALDHRVEWFLSDDDPGGADESRALDLFRRAPPALRAHILETLEGHAPGPQRASRVCLIGLRGAGKSTLGAKAGERLGLPFVELNDEIEALSGIPVMEILALYGQEGYRRLEMQALEHVIDRHESLILAVAGGIVSEPEAYRLLLERFHSIWIKASPEEHMARVRAQGDTRPMAGNPAAMEQLKSILRSREADYGQATAQIDTAGRTLGRSLDDLVTLITERGFVTPD